jgi:hypothetical protein
MAQENASTEGGEHMAETESLVLGVTSTPVVQDRAEVQLSDGGVGDSGETNDGG